MPVSLAFPLSLTRRPAAQARFAALALLAVLALQAAPAPAAEHGISGALRAGLVQSPQQGELHAWYAARNYAPAWTDAHGLTANGRIALKTLAQVGNEGLPPARYALPATNGPATNLHAPEQLARLDLSLSRALRQYIQDVQYGAANPNAPAEGLNGLTEAASAQHLDRYLAQTRPHDPAYARLRGVLAAARAKADPASLARVQDTILALEKMRWDHSGTDMAQDMTVNSTSVALLDSAR